MLDGLVDAQRKFKHPQKIANEIVACVALSWAKFTDEAEAIFVLDILNKLLPLISEPGPEIADICKQSLKSQNRYTLICMSLTLSFCYKKPEHIDQFASVK